MTTRRQLGPLALVAVLALSACGSDGTAPTDLGRERLQRRNRQYLISIGWQEDQAACVSRLEQRDLTVLLDGSNDDDPTRKAGFVAFAKVAQRCVRTAGDLTTTTR